MGLGRLTLTKASNAISLQDEGRKGFQHLGITDGGAADKYSSRWANYLLGNTLTSPVIEICMGNTEIHFSAKTHAVVTGAMNKVLLNKIAIPTWTSFTLHPGDTLSLGFPSSGLYNYLALKQGVRFDEENQGVLYSSHSMNAREHCGPNKGAFFNKGDAFSYTISKENHLHRSPHWQAIPNYDLPIILNVIPCAQYKNFSNHDITRFFNTEFLIQANSNKMGVRLKGEALDGIEKAFSSEGVVCGSIQIPPSGEPIVLTAEHQTIGGYPKIGTVYKTDVYTLSQGRPGQSVQFRMGSLEQAQTNYATHLNRFNIQTLQSRF